MATKTKPADDKLHISYMTLEELLAHPENPKAHDPENIAASYRRFGFNDPFAIDEASGYLAEGHGRLKSLLQDRTDGKAPPKHVVVANGVWTVPVIRGVSFTSDRELRAYITAHNRLTENGGWDDKKLSVILQDAKEFGSLDGMGWTDRQVDSFLESMAPSGQDDIPDDVPRRGGAKNAAMLSNTMRQVVLYFDAEAYEAVLERLQSVMSDNGLDSHSDAMLHLLDVYELKQAE